MKCPHCSAFVDADVERCWRCGRPITAEERADPPVSRAARRRARRLRRQRRFRAFTVGALVVFVIVVAGYVVYDLVLAPDPASDDDIAVGVLPALGDLPAGWARGAGPDASSFSDADLDACARVPSGEIASATTAEEAAAVFRFDGGLATLAVASRVFDDRTRASEAAAQYGSVCAAERLAASAVDGLDADAASIGRLDVRSPNASVHGRRIEGASVDRQPAVVDVVAVGVDRAVVVFVRAAERGVDSGLSTAGLVETVAARMGGELSS